MVTLCALTSERLASAIILDADQIEFGCTTVQMDELRVKCCLGWRSREACGVAATYGSGRVLIAVEERESPKVAVSTADSDSTSRHQTARACGYERKNARRGGLTPPVCDRRDLALTSCDGCRAPERNAFKGKALCD